MSTGLELVQNSPVGNNQKTPESKQCFPAFFIAVSKEITFLLLILAVLCREHCL